MATIVNPPVDVSVGLALGQSPHVTSPTYTEISTYVLHGSLTRGRSQVVGHNEPGRLSLVLNNEDGRFDPSNTSSPYYPNLKPGTQVRVQVTDGSTYQRYHGYIARPVVSDPLGGVKTASIECVDVLGLLGQHTLTTLGYARKVKSWSPAPVAYWRLGGRDSAISGDDETKRHEAIYVFGRTGAAGLLTGDEDGAADLGTRARYITLSPDAAVVGTVSFAVSLLIKPSALPGAGFDTVYLQKGDFEVRLESTGAVSAVVNPGSVVLSTAAGLVSANNVAWIGLRRVGTALDLYAQVGGTFEAVAGSTASTGSYSRSAPYVGASGDGVATLAGLADEVAIWHADPGSTWGSTLAGMAIEPWRNDSTTTRLDNIAALANVPAARRAVIAAPTGSNIDYLLGTATASGSALEALRTLATSRSAEMYASRSGVLTLREYRFPEASPTVAFTLGDASDIPYSALETDTPHTDLQTRVTVSDGTNTATAGDDSEQTQDQSATIYPADSGSRSHVHDVALRLWRRAKTVRERVASVRVGGVEGGMGGLSQAQRQTIWGIDLDSIGAVTRNAYGTGATTRTGRVTRMDERFTPSSYTVDLGFRPVDQTYVASSRSSKYDHTTVASGNLVPVTNLFDRWDSDAIFRDPGYQARLLDDHPHIVGFNDWWDPDGAGIRQATINGGTAEMAVVTDVGMATGGGAHIVGQIALGAETEMITAFPKVFQNRGSSLALRASNLNNGTYSFSPDFFVARLRSTRHAVRAYHSANQSISSGTTTTVALNSERFDLDGMHDNATNNSRLTTQKAAWFFVLANGRIAAHATGFRQGEITVNGTGTVIATANSLNPGGADDAAIQVSSLWKAGSGDYFEHRVHQNSGTALNLITSARWSPEFAAVELAGPGARVRRTSAGSVANTTAGNWATYPATTITWQTARVDDASLWDGANALIPNSDGYWLIWACVPWDDNGTGERMVRIMRNSLQIIAMREQVSFAGTTCAQIVWTVQRCNSGDKLEVQAQQSSVGSLGVPVHPSWGPEFAICKIETGDLYP